MQREAGATGPALAVVTDASDVLATVFHQEDVSPSIDPLRRALQAAAHGGQRLELDVVSDHHEKVDVLGLDPIGANRPNQADLTNAGDLDRRSDEIQARGQQFRTTTGFRQSNHDGCWAERDGVPGVANSVQT